MPSKLIKIIYLILLCVGSGLTACNTPNYAVPTNVPHEQLSKLVVYRKYIESQANNPENPAVYIDDKIVGQLIPGGHVEALVAPGEHIITIKEPVLYLPVKESGRLKINFESQENYFLRYQNQIVPERKGVYFGLTDEESFKKNK